MRNFRTFFEDCANKFNDDVYLYNEEHRLSYRETYQKAIGLANCLNKHGVSASSTVFFRIERNLESIVLLFSLLFIGSYNCLVDPHSPVHEFQKDSGVEIDPDFFLSHETGEWILSTKEGKETTISFWEENGDKLIFEDLIDLKKAVLISFTSGSTSRSKGVLASMGSLLGHSELFKYMTCYEKYGKSISLLPLFHVFGFAQFLTIGIFGGSMYFPESLDIPLVVERINRYKIERLDAVPAYHLKFASLKEELGFKTPTLRVGITAGSFLSEANHNLICKTIGIRLLPVYGQTECLSITGFEDDDTSGNERCSIGKFIKGTEGHILKEDGTYAKPGEQGEIIVKSIQAMNGYVGNEPSPVDENGFLHTGDVAYIDEEGYLHFVGRIKDIIIKNGLNISSLFLETSIGSLPYVSEVAVTNIPSHSKGERILAAVVLKDEVGEGKIRQDLQSKLHKNEMPDRFMFLKELPRRPNGKVDKLRIKEMFLQG